MSTNLIKKPTKPKNNILENYAQKNIDRYRRGLEQVNTHDLPTTGLVGLGRYAYKNPTGKDKNSPSALTTAPYAFGRLAEIGIGSSLLLNYLPVANASLSGNLYHGTSMEHLPSILDKGLQTAYAGQAKRLNAAMLTGRVADDLSTALGRSLTGEEREGIANVYRNFKPHSSKGIVDELIGHAKDVARKNGASEKNISELGKNLSHFGKRIYFGYAPYTVMSWGTHANEGEMALNAAERNLFKKRGMSQSPLSYLANMADIATGGIGSNVGELHKFFKERRNLRNVPVKHMRLDEAKAYLAKSKYMQDAAHHYGAILGIKPTAEELKGLGSFSDFPVVGPLMASNTGLRNFVKRFVPNYSPGRDISVPSDISAKSIRSIDIVKHESGKAPKMVERIMLDKDKKLKDSFFRKLKTINKPALFATVGGTLMLGDAIFGSKWLAHMLQKKKQKNELEKKSGLSPENAQALKKALGVGLVSAGLVGSIGLPLALAQRKAHKEYVDKTKGMASLTASASAQGARVASVLPTASTITIASRNNLSQAMGGLTAMDMGNQYNPERAMYMQLSGLRGYPGGVLLPNKVNQFVKNNATTLALGGAALSTGLGAGAAHYIYNRYYALPLQSEYGDKIRKVQPFNMLDFKKGLKKYYLPLLGISLLTAGGTIAFNRWINNRKLIKGDEK